MDYAIGDWVQVNAIVISVRDGKKKLLKRRKLVSPVFGQVIGLVRRYQGTVDKDWEGNTFVPESNELLVKVITGWTSRPLEARESDLDTTEERKLPYQSLKPMAVFEW